MFPQARASLFTTLPGDYGSNMDQLVQNAGKLKAYGKVLDTRGDGSLSSFTHIGAVVEAAVHGLPGFASLVTGIGANRALALALTNPSTAAYLARARGEMAAKAASYLGRVYQAPAPTPVGGFNQ